MISVIVKAASGILVTLFVVVHASAKDGLEMVDGRFVDGRVVMEDHHGAFIINSPRSHMAQSIPRALVHSVTDDGNRKILHPKRELTPEERQDLAPVLWADSGELEDPLPAYATEQWDVARLYVWASPGKSGDFLTPSNWLVDGRPATEPPDEDCDLLVPQAEEGYEVYSYTGEYRGRNPVRNELKCRHLTVEKNATLIGGSVVWGNRWTKPGGRISPGVYYFRGNRHTVCRRNRPAKTSRDNNWVTELNTARSSRKISVEKKTGISVQFEGRFKVGDETYVSSGRMIVGPGSFVFWNAETGRGTLECAPDAVIELRSGSKFGAAPQVGAHGGDLKLAGSLYVGTPERPISDDVTIYCRWNDLEGDKTKLNLNTGGRYPDALKNRYLKGKFGSSKIWGYTRYQAGLGIGCTPQTKIRVHSADQKTARLIVTANTSLLDPAIRSNEYVQRAREKGSLPKADRDVTAAGSDRGVTHIVQGDVVFRDTVFDYLVLRGLIVEKSLLTKWERVAFGPHNAGEPKDLYHAFDQFKAEQSGAKESPKKEPLIQ